MARLATFGCRTVRRRRRSELLWSVAFLLLSGVCPASAQPKVEDASQELREKFSLLREPWQGTRACGVNCLFVFLRGHGRLLSHRELLDKIPREQRGISLAALKDFSESVGIRAEVVRAKPLALKAIPLPAIALMGEGLDNHFVVLSDARGSRLTLIDGTTGQTFDRDLSRFQSEWSGYLLIASEIGFSETLLRFLFALDAGCALLGGCIIAKWSASRLRRRRQLAAGQLSL
jgi:Peptidase C39 family